MRAFTTYLVLLVCMVLALPGCGGAPQRKQPLTPRVAGGVLLPTGELGAPFVVQQRIKGQYGSNDTTLDCVVQLAKGKLTVIGLTPFGTRAFVVEQVGTEVKFEKLIERDVPFSPVEMLYDIHRVFFRGLPSPQSDGTHEALEHGEMVRERWEGGHLVERRFQGLEGPAPDLVVIAYEGAPAPFIAPHVRLTNVTYGYTLEIDNVEQKALEQGYTLEVERTDAPDGAR